MAYIVAEEGPDLKTRMIDGGSLGVSSHTRGEGNCAGCNFDGDTKWIAGRLGEQDGAG